VWRRQHRFHLSLLVFSFYLFAMLSASAFLLDNPGFLFAKGEVVNPFETIPVSNYSNRFSRFEGYVVISSGVKDHDLHLYALPGEIAQIYRNFSVLIFANMPCFYEVKIDDQVYERGYCEWRSVVKASSPYTTVNVEVLLLNETNVSLPLFEFKDLKLLDSPWEAIEEGEGPVVVEEWIRFTRGEFTTWVLMRIGIQILFAFLGIVSGTSYATVHADLRGIERIV